MRDLKKGNAIYGVIDGAAKLLSTYLVSKVPKAVLSKYKNNMRRLLILSETFYYNFRLESIKSIENSDPNPSS